MFYKIKERLDRAINVVLTNRIVEDLKTRDLEYELREQVTPCLKHGEHRLWCVDISTPDGKPSVSICAQRVSLIRRRVMLTVIQAEYEEEPFPHIHYKRSTGRGSSTKMLQFLAPLLDHIHVDWIDERMMNS